MTTLPTPTTSDLIVRQQVTVKAPPAEAFRLFTADIDSWWPRSHHIGKSPMKRILIEGRAGGRCYSEQEDGTDCDWGSVLVWEPPTRLVLAWQITSQWTFEPALEKSSEVEIRFVPVSGSTRVELEHRWFERHGAGGEAMRQAIASPSGWSGILQLYAERVARTAGEAQ